MTTPSKRQLDRAQRWLADTLQSFSAPSSPLRLREQAPVATSHTPKPQAARHQPRKRRKSHVGRWLVAIGLGGVAGYRWMQRRRATGMDLTDKVVLIAGASRGLGLAMAEEFALHGAKLVLCAREADKLEDSRHRVAALGAEVFAMPCDITDRVQVQQLVDAAIHRFGRIDILVNNASTLMVGPARDLSYNDYHEEMNITFWGALNMTAATLPHMLARRQGRIVNIGSVGGKVSIPHLLAYSSAKFALVGWSEGLRAELAQDGIIVTTVAPGLMRTGSPINTQIKGQHQAEFTWFDLLGTSPFTSISAQSAAKQIVRATQRGDTEIILSWQAKLLTFTHGVAPGIVVDLLSVVNRLLPKPVGGSGKQRRMGAQSETPVTRSFLTGLGQAAAKQYQER